MSTAVVSYSTVPNRSERRRQQREEKRRKQWLWWKVFKNLFLSVALCLANPFAAYVGKDYEALHEQSYTWLFEPAADGAELSSDQVKELARMREEISTLNALVGQPETENKQLEKNLAVAEAAPDVEWVAATNNASCKSVCAAKGLTAVASGNGFGNPGDNGSPYVVCAVNNGCYRAGFNHWMNSCWVAWGASSRGMAHYNCLCEKNSGLPRLVVTHNQPLIDLRNGVLKRSIIDEEHPWRAPKS